MFLQTTWMWSLQYSSDKRKVQGQGAKWKEIFDIKSTESILPWVEEPVHQKMSIREPTKIKVGNLCSRLEATCRWIVLISGLFTKTATVATQMKVYWIRHADFFHDKSRVQLVLECYLLASSFDDFYWKDSELGVIHLYDTSSTGDTYLLHNYISLKFY